MSVPTLDELLQKLRDMFESEALKGSEDAFETYFRLVASGQTAAVLKEHNAQFAAQCVCVLVEHVKQQRKLEQTATLLRGGQCDLPTTVSVCPECGGSLYLANEEWNPKTGWPTQSGFSVYCVAEEKLLDEWGENDQDDRLACEVSHKRAQSDWQPVRDVVWKWIQQIADEQSATNEKGGE